MLVLNRLTHTLIGPYTHGAFFNELIKKTNNFGNQTWLGKPIWQNVLDLWTMQETIFEVRPELIVECGTNRGGSSYFFAQLFDLMGSEGKVVTIDVEKLHDLSHPRVTYLLGSSTAPEIVAQVAAMVANTRGPVLVILDSDHTCAHVRRELDCYAGFVTKDSYCLVQDGILDVLPEYEGARPGPLRALEDFLTTTDEFVVNQERCDRYLITHHPKGWLKRIKGGR